MGKRKRSEAPNGAASKKGIESSKKTKPTTKPVANSSISTPFAIQIVTGSYDRILHGLTASVSADQKVEFADTFLFNAHSAAIRCLAISPPSAPEPGKTQKVMLASGGSDERINIYALSAHPPSSKQQDDLSAVAPRRIREDSKNREMGALLHHSSPVTRLSFPTKSKLISSAEDSTMAVTRARDWSLLSVIKAPIPKPLGRPSGDTAGLNGTPAGVNDFAVHPSMKLMISVSKGEKCMRLWNLMTAKKAGVLNFSRDLLQEVGEGRHSSGEGRRVVWGSTEEGDELCVGFDRDLVVFGMDSTPRCRVMPTGSRTKIHQFRYLTTGSENDSTLLAVSTEDGRILFFSTKAQDLSHSEPAAGKKSTPSLPVAKLVAQLGGKPANVAGRIKDFAILEAPGSQGRNLIIPAGSSDGKVRVFHLSLDELDIARESCEASPKGGSEGSQVGILLGTYETQNRVTCLDAFIMIPRPEGAEDSEDDFEDSSDEDDDEEEDA